MNANRFDVHHHIFPPAYMKAVADAGFGDAGGVAFPHWSVESALALMDRHDIATAITSVAAPGVYFGNEAAARDLARYCNEFSARLVMDHPSRFGAFGVLPLPDVDGALTELEYAFDTLKLDGVVLLSNIAGTYLGDPAFDAVFDELNRRKAVVFMHPDVHPTTKQIKLSFPGATIEFVFDTTRAVTNLIASGTLERCPDLKIILPHAGGTVPYVAWRMSLLKLAPGFTERAPQGAMAYLQRLYYETAISGAPNVMSSLKELVEPSHILYGSDNPFLPEPLISTVIEQIEEYAGFSETTRREIQRDNGMALFPRFQTIAATTR
jgi:6-methylsalicylate decarboxylase